MSTKLYGLYEVAKCHKPHPVYNSTDAYRHSCGRCGGDRRQGPTLLGRFYLTDEEYLSYLTQLPENHHLVALS